MLKKTQKKQLMVNTGQFMFSGNFFITDPLIQLKNRW